MIKCIVLILSLFFSVAGFGQQQMYLRATAAGGGPVNLLLDDYPGAAVAYSVHKLDKDYAGSCLRVRRDSDSAEQDIGFSGSDLDEASLISFCSGANCFVKTWYDQSGNSRDLTQSTTSKQPKIYDSSTGIEYVNSLPGIKFDGSSTWLRSASFTTVNFPVTLFTSYRVTTMNFPYIVELQNVNARSSYAIWNASGGHRLIINGNYSLYGGVIATATQYLAYGLYSSTPAIAKNGGTAVTGSVSPIVSLMNQISVGASYSGITGTFLNGHIQCLVVYSSDQSSNRTAIETIINNYFSIY